MEILGLIDIPLWMLLLLSFLLLLYVYGTWNHSVWKNQAVPGPRPWPLLGNSVEVFNKSFFHVFTEWQKKYGRVIGFHMGNRPVLAITDLDMVREVMVKQFNNFTERSVSRRLRPRVLDKGVFFVWGPTWKRIRSLMTPAFSTAKLKLMSCYVRRCSDLLSRSIENKARSGELINVKEVFQAFTLDVIAGTAFGLDTDSQTQEEEPFIRHCRLFFSTIGAPGLVRFVIVIVQAFPFMASLLRRFSVQGTAHKFFFTALEKMVDERLEMKNRPHQKGEKRADFLQMLADSEADAEDILDFADNNDISNSHRRLTKEEIMAQGFLVLLAGFETTATTLHYLAYNLTLHPDIQQKVFEEIQDQLGDADPTYENISELKYLEATIRETLRLFPPIASVGRRAEKSTTVHGVHIPAGCDISIPIYTILHDPEYFPDPDLFDPDRFLEENFSKIPQVAAELAFGYGPRKCIGMRLAFVEIKMAAAVVFRKFRFVRCPETPDKVTLGQNITLPISKEVIKMKAEFRNA